MAGSERVVGPGASVLHVAASFSSLALVHTVLSGFQEGQLSVTTAHVFFQPVHHV